MKRNFINSDREILGLWSSFAKNIRVVKEAMCIVNRSPDIRYYISGFTVARSAPMHNLAWRR